MIYSAIKRIIPSRLKVRLREYRHWEKVRKQFPILSSFSNKTGIEIGGPSQIFSNMAYFPIYNVAKSIDGVNFSNNTVWEGKINEGQNYFYSKGKSGHQFIGEASDLSFVEDNKYDFLLASHCLEHCANAIKTVMEWKRVVKQGGLLFLILPNKEYTFDHNRSVTKFTHLVEDYKNNVTERDLTHLEEILELHDLSMDPPVENKKQFEERSKMNFENRCFHQHIFDTALLKELYNYIELKPVFEYTIERNHILVGKKII
jgi:SAM-dependent methyltransferase